MNIRDMFERRPEISLPTSDNMADVFDPVRQRQTEDQQRNVTELNEAGLVDYGRATTIDELYTFIQDQPFILGDDGERIATATVLQAIRERNFPALPQYNNLRANAQRVAHENDEHILEF